MNYGSGNVTKYHFSCHLTAALGYITVKARDSIGLFLHGEKIDMKMDARNSFLHLNNMLKRVQEFEPSGETGLAETLHQIAGSVRRRALIIIISDLLGDEEEIAVALAHLRKQRHDVIVFHVLDPMEIDLSMKHACEFEDLENGSHLTVNPRAMVKDYQKVFGAFLERCQKTCSGLKIDYRLARSDQDLETFVRAYLEERRRLSR
jgi:uncharacterized protein (DUF58 family)